MTSTLVGGIPGLLFSPRSAAEQAGQKQTATIVAKHAARPEEAFASNTPVSPTARVQIYIWTDSISALLPPLKWYSETTPCFKSPLASNVVSPITPL